MGLGAGWKHSELPFWEERTGKWEAVGGSLSMSAGLYHQEVLMARPLLQPEIFRGSAPHNCVERSWALHSQGGRMKKVKQVQW